MFSSPTNDEQRNNNSPNVEKATYILHKQDEPLAGVDTGRTREEVVNEMKQRTAEFVRELKEFIADQKLENDVSVLNVMEFIGMVVVEATPEGRQKLESMDKVIVSENGEVHLIAPVEDNDLRLPKRPDNLDDLE